MSEQPLDLRSTLRVLRRSRISLAVLVLLGAALGIFYGLSSPAKPTATALVLLPPAEITPTGTPARDMKTQVAVAESSPVLSTAGSHLSPPIDERDMRKAIKVSAISADVLSFRARAATPKRATQIANSAASSYIAYVTSPNSYTNADVLAGLKSKTATLNNQLQGLQAQIDSTQSHLAAESPSSPAGQRDSALLGSLSTEQEAVSVELNNVTSQLIQDQASSQQGAATTRVLQSALVSRPSQVAHLAEMAGGFAGSCLLLGCIVVISRARRDRRLRKRVDIASAASAPMLATVHAKSPRTVEGWKSLLTAKSPDAADNWALRQLLQSLSLDSRATEPAVDVISFADDPPALTVGPRIAAFSASCGTVTRLEVDDVIATERLRAACSSLARQGSPPSLQLPFAGRRTNGSTWQGGAVGPCQLIVRCRVVTRGEGPITGVGTSSSLLVLAPGIATADDIATVALRLDERGEQFDGTILVNPDPTDDTAGLPQNLALMSASDTDPGQLLDRETSKSAERER